MTLRFPFPKREQVLTGGAIRAARPSDKYLLVGRRTRPRGGFHFLGFIPIRQRTPRKSRCWRYGKIQFLARVRMAHVPPMRRTMHFHKVHVACVHDSCETGECMDDRPPVDLPCHDDLSKLARDDPAAFEALRQALIASTIDSAPERIRARLRGIQFQVDGIRRLSRSPLGATVKIYGLMWDSFLKMNDSLQDFIDSTSESPQLPTVRRTAHELPPPAKIIRLQQRSCVARELAATPANALPPPSAPFLPPPFQPL